MAFIGPLRLFYIRAQVRAYLLAVGEFQTFEEAFGPLREESIALSASVGSSAVRSIVEQCCSDAGIEFVDVGLEAAAP